VIHLDTFWPVHFEPRGVSLLDPQDRSLPVADVDSREGGTAAHRPAPGGQVRRDDGDVRVGRPAHSRARGQIGPICRQLGPGRGDP
jgi:hypothetical protein